MVSGVLSRVEGRWEVQVVGGSHAVGGRRFAIELFERAVKVLALGETFSRMPEAGSAAFPDVQPYSLIALGSRVDSLSLVTLLR